MTHLKIMLKSINAFFVSLWGLTIVDFIPLLEFDLFSTLNENIKILMSFAGLIYFLITIPHKLKMNKLNRQLKEEELERIIRKNENID